jgi:hypothetical protein
VTTRSKAEPGAGRVGDGRPRSFRGLGRGCFVENAAELAFFGLGERRGSWRMGLEQRPKEYPIVLLGALGTEIPLVDLASHVLGLEDLRFALTAPLADTHSYLMIATLTDLAVITERYSDGESGASAGGHCTRRADWTC